MQEFDPEEFYRLLEAAEGQAKETIKTDIPKYIVGKLGLNVDPLADIAEVNSIDSGRPDTPDTDESSEVSIPGALELFPVIHNIKICVQLHLASSLGHPSTRELLEKKPPCQEDYETIKLVSNGAYGYVVALLYLLYIRI